MRKTVELSEMTDIKIMPETEEEEIVQNLNTITQIPAGSAPMCRNVGMRMDAVHRKEPTARVLAVRDLSIAIQEQESRANLILAESESEDGKMRVVAEVEIDG